jgi:hypothetical protein
MFETLERSERPLKYRWLLLMFYGTYCLVGVVYGTLSVMRHGLSQPAHLALSFALFLLSLMWLRARALVREPHHRHPEKRDRRVIEMIYLGVIVVVVCSAAPCGPKVIEGTGQSITKDSITTILLVSQRTKGPCYGILRGKVPLWEPITTNLAVSLTRTSPLRVRSVINSQRSNDVNNRLCLKAMCKEQD